MTRTFLLFLFFIFFTILPNYVYSYCVYNKMTDNTFLYVEQTDGQGARGKAAYVLLSILFFIVTSIILKKI